MSTKLCFIVVDFELFAFFFTFFVFEAVGFVWLAKTRQVWAFYFVYVPFLSSWAYFSNALLGNFVELGVYVWTFLTSFCSLVPNRTRLWTILTNSTRSVEYRFIRRTLLTAICRFIPKGLWRIASLASFWFSIENRSHLRALLTWLGSLVPKRYRFVARNTSSWSRVVNWRRIDALFAFLWCFIPERSCLITWNTCFCRDIINR